MKIEAREGERLILMGSDSQFRLSVYMYADEVDEREKMRAKSVRKWAHAHAAALGKNQNWNASSTSPHRRIFHIY